MVRELQSASALRRQPIRTVLPRERALGYHAQVLQLPEEIVFEAQGHFLKF
jgi:hypothetical protein